jgi:hypothetical protein
MAHNDLIARLEAATGPDRELDAAIAQAVGFVLRLPEQSEGPERLPDVKRWYHPDGHAVGWYEGSDQFPSYYTASIDAALTLMPEGSLWNVSDYGDRRPGVFLAVIMGTGLDALAVASTPALAIGIAALRAQAHREGEG